MSLSNSKLRLISVTKSVLEKLLQQPFIQEHYLISDIDGRTWKSWYGVVLLISTRLQTRRMRWVDFPRSSMGRCLLMADIEIQPQEFVRFGSVHLESLNNRAQRSEQLQICRQALEEDSPSTQILLGDFNFADRNEEDAEHFRLLPGWIDVWTSVVVPSEPRYTFDTELNPMTRRSNGGRRDRSRYDRILLHSRSVAPTSIRLVGQQPLASLDHRLVFVSDHFGLLAHFRFTLSKNS